MSFEAGGPRTWLRPRRARAVTFSTRGRWPARASRLPVGLWSRSVSAGQSASYRIWIDRRLLSAAPPGRDDQPRDRRPAGIVPGRAAGDRSLVAVLWAELCLASVLPLLARSGGSATRGSCGQVLRARELAFELCARESLGVRPYAAHPHPARDPGPTLPAVTARCRSLGHGQARSWLGGGAQLPGPRRVQPPTPSWGRCSIGRTHLLDAPPQRSSPASRTPSSSSINFLGTDCATRSIPRRASLTETENVSDRCSSATRWRRDRTAGWSSSSIRLVIFDRSVARLICEDCGVRVTR